MPAPLPANGGGIPRSPVFDSTLSLLRQGYRYVSSQCERLGSEAFRTRLMLRKVVCTRGADAAAMFYHPGRFTRQGAIPPTVVAQLQDFGSVQQQDGAAHLHRKAMFLDVLGADSTARMVGIFRQEWRARAGDWQRRPHIVLHPEVEQVFGRTVCRWAGIRLDEGEAEKRIRDLAATIDGAGSFGPRMLRGLASRRKLERWIRQEIARLRAGAGATADADPPAPAEVIARHRDLDGKPLDQRTAAVEVINLLRPTVAVARWVTFAALALHRHPGCLARLRSREPGYLLRFVQEVRRFYPFFPIVGGRVREPFDWKGHRFDVGDWVMFDLYGTNHDPRHWREPERFDPDRFADWNGSPYDLVPQGGGDVERTHRCPGENPSIALLMVAVDELANGMEYTVPEQDLDYRLNRFPSIPESRFVTQGVKLRTGEAEGTG